MPGNKAVQVDKWRFFSEAEAWLIFRLGAYGEAFGWSLLIFAVIYRHYHLANNGSVVIVLGQIHGVFFFCYFAGLVATFRSLSLRWWQVLLGIAVGVPPYGTLVFEKWLERRRTHFHANPKLTKHVYAIIEHDHKLLVVQPLKGVQWQLPGGLVSPDENNKASLQRHLQQQFGVKVDIHMLDLQYNLPLSEQSQTSIFYTVNKSEKFVDKHLTNAGKQLYEARKFLPITNEIELFPQTIKAQLISQQTK